MSQACTHAEAVGLAFDEIRLASAGMPTVQIYLLEILHLLADSLGSGASCGSGGCVAESSRSRRRGQRDG